ncbi:hypothetical protein FHT40_005396 [Mycolicibacterium sp. BK556]|uniref:hypothetical protein n=1 Tax=unclassified Mycolicibacterium TaxID=2636767 RepID=UPI00161419D2|nr:MULTISPECIES: hypothetical protein [unclassified Mycolicibacterium]MBB3605709.1 hypothetical protein [Mycolicibacterium sp. BK556]MBB3635794.1 hypothetical protein [Mycolicibacterium sp. BK607]
MIVARAVGGRRSAEGTAGVEDRALTRGEIDGDLVLGGRAVSDLFPTAVVDPPLSAWAAPAPPVANAAPTPSATTPLPSHA